MFLHIIYIFLTIYFQVIKSENEKYLKNNRMIGFDTVHDVRIDKDTIITRNMNLKNKNRGETAKTSGDPDWSYSSFSKEIRNDVEEFKRNMTECLKEVQANDKRKVKSLSPKKDSPVHAECLIACVLKRNSVIINGKVNKENLLVLVRKFYGKDERLLKKLEKNLDHCIESSINNKNECTLAAQLNECTNSLMATHKHKMTINY